MNNNQLAPQYRAVVAKVVRCHRDWQGDEDRLHFVFDIGRKPIKPIKYRAALLLVDQQSCKVSQAWNMQHAK